MHRCRSACSEAVGADVGRADALFVEAKMCDSFLEGPCDATDAECAALWVFWTEKRADNC